MACCRILTCSENVCVWDLGTYSPVFKLDLPTVKSFTTLAWDTDDHFISVPSDHSKLIFSSILQNDIDSKEFDVGVNINAISCNPKAAHVAVGSSTGEVLCWDRKQEKIVKTLAEMPSGVTALKYDLEASRIAVGCYSGQISIVNSLSGFSSTTLKINDSPVAVKSLHVHQQSKFLLGSTFESGQVAVWDMKHSCLFQLLTEEHKAPAMDVKFSPLGNSIIASVGLDKRILIHDARASKLVTNIRCEVPLRTLEFLPGGMAVLVGGSRGMVYTYDLKTSKILNQFAAHTGHVQKVAISGIQSEKPRRRANVRTRKVLSPAPNLQQSTNCVPSSPPEPCLPVPSSTDSTVVTTTGPEVSTESAGLRKTVLKKSLLSSPNTFSQERSSEVSSPDSLNTESDVGTDVFSSPRLNFCSDNKENILSVPRLGSPIPEELEQPIKTDAKSPGPKHSTAEKGNQTIGGTLSMEDVQGLTETIGEMQQSLHKEIMAMHFQMIKQFVNMQVRLEELYECSQINTNLAEEVLHLREENKRLRTSY